MGWEAGQPSPFLFQNSPMISFQDSLNAVSLSDDVSDSTHLKKQRRSKHAEKNADRNRAETAMKALDTVAQTRRKKTFNGFRVPVMIW